ncbi:MAG: tetratricopeptide repeat protein, partial [Elusimicrobiota bacterium]|nr:tetratricopeptide repeat protein [Elusimicrobiota bacterium]
VFGSLGIYFYIRYTGVKKSAWDKISIAQGYAHQGMTNQSIQLLDDIISKFGNSDIGQQARLTKADICFKTKNYNLAAQIYQQVIDGKKGGRTKNIIPFAYAQLGATKENLGDYQGAISTYNEFIVKFPEHFLVPRIYDSLARVYLVTGSSEQAKQTYEKLVTLYPGTYWAQQVQRNFSALP